MRDPEYRVILLERYLSSVKKYGDDERVKKALSKSSSYLKDHPENKRIRVARKSLLRVRCKDREVISKEIEENAAFLTNHIEDKNVRSAHLCLVRDKGLLRTADIRWTLEDAQQYMEKFGPHPLFQDYVTLVLKVVKTGIDVNIDVEFVRQIGYSFVNSVRGKFNIRATINFANLLISWKYFDEAERIYEDLLKARADRETRSNVYFYYGKMLLIQAMSLEFAKNEYLRRLHKAEEKFMNAFRVNEMHYMALTFLSIALREQRKEREAEDVLGDAHRIAKRKKKGETSPGEIPYKIGVFYLEFNRFKDAIYWLELASKRDPKDWTNWWKLGTAKTKLAVILEDKDVKQSTNLLREALSNLELSIKKAPTLLQLPASEEIPNLIATAKTRLKKHKI